jgi:hypothetical protein
MASVVGSGLAVAGFLDGDGDDSARERGAREHERDTLGVNGLIVVDGDGGGLCERGGGEQEERDEEKRSET